jgi:hypothetical protein
MTKTRTHPMRPRRRQAVAAAAPSAGSPPGFIPPQPTQLVRAAPEGKAASAGFGSANLDSASANTPMTTYTDKECSRRR